MTGDGVDSAGLDLGMDEGKFLEEDRSVSRLGEGIKVSGCGGMPYAEGWIMCAAMSASASISSSVI